MSIRNDAAINFWQTRVKSLTHCLEVCEAAGNNHGYISKFKLYREAREKLRRLRA